MRSSTDPLEPDNVVPALVASNAGAAPDREAVIEVATGRSTSWSALQREVGRWVGAMRTLGVREGDRVVTMLAPGATAHAVWLACGWLRALEVPVGAAYRGALLAHLVNDSGADIVVTHAAWAPRFAEIAGSRADVGEIVVVEDDSPSSATTTPASCLLPDIPPALDDPPRPSDIAAVMYTSGTTGSSKGVLVPWAQLASGIEAFDDCREGDVLFAPFSPSHLAGKLPLQLMAFWTGTHVVRDAFKTQTFWTDVRDHSVNRAWLFHALANFLWREPERADDADNPLESVTGGPLLHEYRRFGQRFGVRMRTNFGMTEVGWPIVTGDRIDDPLSCGRARAGYDLRVVDDVDREVPDGTVGELIIRADRPWVMNQGYLGRWEETARAWRNGWFHTGDGFRRDADGNYFFVDRIKDSIRRRSENISSFEVESLVGEHPDVLEVAAVGVPAEHGEEEVLVCVVPKPGIAVDPAELTRYLVDRMPTFMVPRYVTLVDALPKTPTGKVRKVELREAYPDQRTWDRRQPLPAR